MRCLFLLLALIFCSAFVYAQSCNGPGQQPSTAFPVCGTSVFTQTTVPLCSGRRLPAPHCKDDVLEDVNPFWYKFTCYEEGTLGFTITPNDMSDDYDWELYDITGRNPNDVYTQGSMAVASNWSGEGGKTGASAAGSQLFVCGGYGKPLYSKMPVLKKGHEYLLLVSHFTRSQSGYDLAFGGGTAVITDSIIPRMRRAEAVCAGNKVRLKINERIKCSSIAANGSDFFVTPSSISVISSKGIGCSEQFDTDSIELTLSAELAPGQYQLIMKKGADGNTLFDFCNNPVPDGDQVPFILLPKEPTPMDSLAPLECAPRQLKVYFKKPMNCSSLAADGSDFTIQGTYPVTISGAQADCNSEKLSKEIIINLAQPLQVAGTFRLILKKGSDGNTLVDECMEATPEGSFLSFEVKDTVNADFSYNIRYGCKMDTVDYFHSGANGVNSWEWSLDNAQFSRLQNPTGMYSLFNQKTVSLIVSNGLCIDTVQKTVLLENYLKSDFVVGPDVCPQEPVPFTSTAIGKLVGHTWTFGDGGTSTDESPKHIYTAPQSQRKFTVNYTVTDQWGCRQTSSKEIFVYSSCTVSLPNAFTPNADGKNDLFRALNAVKAEQFELVIYNRWGQLVYKTTDWKQGWDGRVNGQLQGSGTYIWMVRYVNRDSKKRIERKGSFVLIR